MDAEQFRKTIKDKFDILLAGGQDHLKGKIFRVGHLGYVNDRDIINISCKGQYAIAYIMRIRNGLLIGREKFKYNRKRTSQEREREKFKKWRCGKEST